MAPKPQELDQDLPVIPKPPKGKSYVTDNTIYLDNAYKALQDMSLKDRLEVLTYLYTKGFHSGTKPTAGGLEPGDISRYAAFLIFASNSKNKEGEVPTPQQAYDSLIYLPDRASTGTKVTYTNKLDVTSVFSQVAERDLGRRPTQKEIAKFADAYRALEAQGAGSTQEPGLQAAAESQLKTQMGGEVEATNFADYATAFQDMLRGA